MSVRTLSLVLLLGISGCPPFPERSSLQYSCKVDEDCSPGSRCSEGRCEPRSACVPRTCGALEGQCGPLEDGCGGTLQCECPEGYACGLQSAGRCTQCETCEISNGRRCGSNIPLNCGPQDCECLGEEVCSPNGLCVCEPQTCEARGWACGEFTSCGQLVVCDTCPFGQSCIQGQCAKAQACADKACGYAQEGDQLVECGRCAPPQMCGVGGAHQCGVPQACVDAQVECGLLTGAGPAWFCGRCGPEEVCEAGRCQPLPRPWCWSAASAWTAVAPTFEGTKPTTAVYVEAGRLVGYQASPRFWNAGEDPGCSRHVRFLMQDALTPLLDTMERLPTSEFSLSPEGCARSPQIPCDGWVSVPKIRSDGLEVFFDGNYACGDWWDPELYLSTRARLDAPWSAPSMLSALCEYAPVPLEGGSTSYNIDFVGYSMLLPDHRTLLFAYGPHSPNLHTSERPSATPGDLRFGEPTLLGFSDENDLPSGVTIPRMRPHSISCDGTLLIYSRDLVGGNTRSSPRAAPLLGLEPLRLGEGRDYGSAGPAQVLREAGTVHLQESPDCSTLYITTDNGTFFSERIPCP